jgi:hypothetical protein
MEAPRGSSPRWDLPPELLVLAIEQGFDAFDPADLLNASLTCRALAAGLPRLDEPRDLGAWLGRVLRQGRPGVALGPVELAPMLEALRELQREPDGYGGATPDDDAAPLAATVACALLSWRRLEGAGPEQLLAALLAALEAAGAESALAAARGAAEAAPERLGDLADMSNDEAGCWQPPAGSAGEPSAAEMAAGAAFATAAWGALEARALLLAPFAAAGGRDALAAAIVGHCIRRLAAADGPMLTDMLGLTQYDFSAPDNLEIDADVFDWLLGASAAAAARRGHAGACLRLVGRVSEGWAGNAVTAAAAGGRVALLQELVAGGTRGAPLVAGGDCWLLAKAAFSSLAANGRAAELGRFIEWCQQRPAPRRMPLRPEGLLFFHPRFVARVAAGNDGLAVLRTLLAFDRRRAAAGELQDFLAAPRSAASLLSWTSGSDEDETAAALVAVLAPPACLGEYLACVRERDASALPGVLLAALQEAAAMAVAGPAAVADALLPLVREALAAVEGCVRDGQAPAEVHECLEGAAAVAMAACDAATAQAVLRAASSRPAAVQHLQDTEMLLDGMGVGEAGAPDAYLDIWDCLCALAGPGGGGSGGGGGGAGVSTRGARRAHVLRAQLAERRERLAGQLGDQAEALQALLQAGLVDRADELAAAMPEHSVEAAAARALGALQAGGQWVENWAAKEEGRNLTTYSAAQGGKLGLLHDARCAR